MCGLLLPALALVPWLSLGAIFRERKVEINNNPPGLISRRTFPIDRGQWVMHEEWDIDAPGCPMVRSPYHSQLTGGNRFVRQVIMSAEEHAEYIRTNSESLTWQK